MKKIEVYNANGDKILACADDLEYYQSIGWKQKRPAKEKAVAAIEADKETE